MDRYLAPKWLFVLMDTLKANQIIHGELAKMGEYDNSPHFFEENKEFVRTLISSFFESINADEKSLLAECLDLGCGTGFMYEILSAFDLGSYLGIDITQNMLDIFHQKYPTARTLISQAENLPFENKCFSFVSSYSFLDHLDDLSVVFSEAFRVLKPGGIFYSGLIPNAAFSNAISYSVEAPSSYLWFNCREHLNKEYNSMHNNGEVYAKKYGFSAETLSKAEPQKSKGFGLKIEEIYSLLCNHGFSDVVICPNWYFGQASYKANLKEMVVIDKYLKSLGPVGQSLFKYFDFFAVK